MALRKLDLFRSKREFIYFLLLLFVIFLYNLFNNYSKFQEIKTSKFYTLESTVLNQYQKSKKNGRVYYVLKLKSSDGYKFITTSYGDLKDIKYRRIELTIITDKLTFLEFLKGFYAPAFNIGLLEYESSFKDKLRRFISDQHSLKYEKELFLALFLADPISKELREEITLFGISHLVAISGYHLGVLFGIFYFLLRPCYGYFQDRYFPYRSMKFDLSVIIIVLLFGYMYMLDFIPSLLRSFVMMVVGFLLMHRHFKILSFEVLSVAVLMILAFLPSFIFSVGFWFSVSGVFYIYLFLHYFSHLKNWQIFIFLNVWVYIAMLPIVHFIFVQFSFYQLLSPLFSVLFGLFYPIEMFLHLIGYGGMLDIYIDSLLHTKAPIYEISTPLWFLIIYLSISIFAAFKDLKER